jgi:Asp-tRNA(Asn)/Glu-tRNA(Gln) amidotransferase A subunit family amidase
MLVSQYLHRFTFHPLTSHAAPPNNFRVLGTDTGDSIHLSASYYGVIGFKSSYGLVSRWGVVAYANSLDTVGVFRRSIVDVKSLFSSFYSSPGTRHHRTPQPP